MKLTDLSKKAKSEYYQNYTDDMLLKYPLLKVPNQDSFFGEKPSLLKKLYNTFLQKHFSL